MRLKRVGSSDLFMLSADERQWPSVRAQIRIALRLYVPFRAIEELKSAEADVEKGASDSCSIAFYTLMVVKNN